MHTILELPIRIHLLLVHRFERVNVQPGVGLVEDSQLRLKQSKLKDLVALLLSARETGVDVAVQKVGLHGDLASKHHSNRSG